MSQKPLETSEYSMEDTKALTAIIELIQAFRGVHPKMALSYALGFLNVARYPGYGPTKYAKLMDTEQPIASRILLEIGPRARSRDNGKGLGLVDRRGNMENLREQNYHLTPEGRMFLRKLVDIVRQQRAQSPDKQPVA